MELILSDTMGYCGGVSRAISLVERAIIEARDKKLPVYSLGKVIHNEQVCMSFADQGLKTIFSPDGHEPGLVVLRAHGVPDKLRQDFNRAGFTLIDATCPVVARNLHLIGKKCLEYSLIVIGHENHPETLAMQGVEVDGKICQTHLISIPEQVAHLPLDQAYAVFVQTTFDRILWNDIREQLQMLQKKGVEIVFMNEVCPSSVDRREAAIRLCKKCDAIVVIGGKESANTKALYALILQQGKKAWHIETEDEVTEEMKQYDILGITAGASTPHSIIESVQAKLQEE
ncbi:MAG: 4-hydroxy-3-methylbut-2-enyl diphosphate reductase [Sphaerochaeta sp.]|nr:4-hydroxy-3-methylbut-2-enyl diphosphate reductase [Sphaerochaeta sp.]